MRPSRRDAFGDGHGFLVSSRRRTVEIRTTEPYRFNYNILELPKRLRDHHKPVHFLGLYEINGQKEVHIIWAGKTASVGAGAPSVRFLTWDCSEHPHYINDPIAWAEMPAW